ncbi:helix-turn-helix domain-containing protein [Streptomyces sp. NBC_01190]|uniref:helix-turn-helix domain-containing protein n=1 Tax=Streptomyces sp. NBC_01190 TaxID=2903767 RepID=UPI00386C0A73|nr:helix-turn-helix transcriptional regulator [Streptomyces sp. NBC_01190]
MQAESAIFGVELRRLRVEAGYSLGEFATLINYTKGYLSKVEHGKRNPSGDLAQICDTALRADGRLSTLISSGDAETPEVTDFGPDAQMSWSWRTDVDGTSEFIAFDPATFSAGRGPVTAVNWLITPTFRDHVEVGLALPHFRMMFHQLRRLGQLLDPAVVAGPAVAATSALRGMARTARPAHRDDVLRLASRFAEYTGWMAQEAGDNAATLWWTEQAVRLAAAGGDDELAAYALVRQAELALYGGDSLSTVALARRAAEHARSERIQGLAAQREAQGHALLGDRDECRRALDRGVALAAGSAPPDAEDPVLGSVHLPDLSAFVAGWCMDELGSPGEAVTLFGGGLDAIDPQAQRARARYGARLALALAHDGEIEQACAVAESVASTVALIDSATIRSDLLRLSRVLNRWPKNSSVSRTVPLIAASLRTGRVRPEKSH